jgi:exonuclease III
MTGITTYLSILTLSVNGLNSPIKRHCLTNWIKKEDPTLCCLQETHLINKSMHNLRVKGWKKIYQDNGPWKQAGVAILISDKADFKPTLIKRDKEGHSILIKGNNNYQRMHPTSMYPISSNIPWRILKTYINSNTVVVGDFNIPLSPIDRSSKQKNQ